jgi:hypothetical protein
MDILLYPLQRLPLVQQSSVQIPSRLDLLTSQETPRTDTIIESDNYDIMVSGFDQTGAVQVCIRESIKAASLNEEIDRMKNRLVRGGIDVKEKAVFRGSRVKAGGRSRMAESSML